jgi:hypothetical protein
VVLALLLPHPGVGSALSIRAQATSDFVLVPRTPENIFGFTFVDNASCLPGIPCGGATVASRYAVRGTSQETIPAQFEYDYTGTNASRYSIFFQATDLKGRLLARVRASGFSDEFGVEATSCGPAPGACVSFTDTTGGAILPGDLPFGPPVPRFPDVSREEFEARGPGGLVTLGSGLVPFFLPVGPSTGISAGLGLDAGISFDFGLCFPDPSQCRSETNAVFNLVALPPPGASFLEPVPEPATLLLVGTTAAGLGLARWRQRRGKRQL